MSTNDPGPEFDTSRSNVVTITDESNTIFSMAFIPGSLHVSEGQPSDPAPKVPPPDGNVFTISLEAGRQDTQPIAQTFNTLSGGKNNEYAPFKEVDDSPSELNFMFGLELQFAFEGGTGSASVYLAQGHVLGVNNWWIGGPNISNFGEPKLLYTAGINDVTLGLSGTHDSFTMRLVDFAKNSPIQHVFALMLENHSFDNMLAMSGIPGINAATTADSNSYEGTPYPVTVGALPAMPASPGHEFTDTLVQLCGAGATYSPGGLYPKINNSGFVANYATTTTEKIHATESEWHDVMGCFNTPVQLPILYELASQFACCDHWYSSLPGPTWPNRFFVHGASSNGLDHSPSSTEIIEWEVPGSGGFTLPHGSIYDAMKVKEVSYGLFNDTEGAIEGSVAQVASLHNLSMLNVRSVNDFVTDLQSDYPYQYTFIEPNYGDISSTYENGSSQHPIDGVKRGEELIKKVYEAIRNSGIWEKSLLIVTYDEHGGFYDHFPPPPAHDPDDGSDTSKWNESGFLFNQSGVRVPAVIVSPWIQAQVDHTDYDHTSVLSTIERLFGLDSLTERDRNAKDLHHLVGKVLRTDCPTKLGQPAPEPARAPLTEAQQALQDQEPLEPRGNHWGFLHVAMKTDLEMSGGTPAERAAIIAKVKAIKTRGEAKAYMRSVMTRVRAAQATMPRP